MTLLPRSITGRLVFWLSAGAAVILTAVGLFLAGELGTIVISSLDRTLHSKRQIITGLLHEEHGRVELELSDIIAGEYVVPRSGHYYRVTTGSTVLAASPSLVDDNFNFVPLKPLSTDKQTDGVMYTSTGPDEEPVRVLRYQYAAFNKIFDITLAESLNASLSMILLYRRFLLITISLSIVVFCLIAWWIAKASLRPLASFSSTIETITHKTLADRIDAEATAQELEKLARSFNAMLDRLSRVFESQKRLVADASHELKTPLSVIKAQCDVALQRTRTPEEYIEALQTIQASSRNMANLIHDLLSMARLDAGLVSSADFTGVSLKDCIEHAVRMTEQLARERQVSITTALEGTLMVAGSQTGLEEAFLNVIENGVRYNREGGTVSVTAAVQDGKALIRIVDSGIGIRSDDLDRIFERFYRADNLRSSDGTGLGLSIAKSVVETHGGTIHAEGEPGKGSRFTIVLPTAVRQPGNS